MAVVLTSINVIKEGKKKKRLMLVGYTVTKNCFIRNCNKIQVNVKSNQLYKHIVTLVIQV